MENVNIVKGLEQSLQRIFVNKEMVICVSLLNIKIKYANF